MNVFVVTIRARSWRWTRRFVPLGTFVCVLAASDAVHAIDYRFSGQRSVATADATQVYSASGHCRLNPIGISTVPFGICAGADPCCCMADNDACCHLRDTSEAQNQDNPPVHQSCCSSGDTCDPGWTACGIGLKSVKLVQNSDCPSGGSPDAANVLITYCEDGTAEPCLETGGWFQATICDVPVHAQGDFANGLLNLCIELENNVTILADITVDDYAAKGIPTLSGFGVVVMAAILLVAGGILLRHRQLLSRETPRPDVT